jgi:hypothetical protein
MNRMDEIPLWLFLAYGVLAYWMGVGMGWLLWH